MNRGSASDTEHHGSPGTTIIPYSCQSSEISKSVASHVHSRFLPALRAISMMLTRIPEDPHIVFTNNQKMLMVYAR